jgi:hypothetical protein
MVTCGDGITEVVTRVADAERDVRTVGDVFVATVDGWSGPLGAAPGDLQTGAAPAGRASCIELGSE